MRGAYKNAKGRTVVKRQCRRCGEAFETYPSDVRRGFGKFCSKRCSRLKHGMKIDDKGYLSISAGPLRGMRVATLVAEAMLGRKLNKDEQAHHKDGNKLNPHWNNIVVLDEKTHGYVSSKQKWFVESKVHAHEKWQWEEALQEVQSGGGGSFQYGHNE